MTRFYGCVGNGEKTPAAHGSAPKLAGTAFAAEGATGLHRITESLS
jgi:hypothetical protein